MIVMSMVKVWSKRLLPWCCTSCYAMHWQLHCNQVTGFQITVPAYKFIAQKLRIEVKWKVCWPAPMLQPIVIQKERVGLYIHTCTCSTCSWLTTCTKTMSLLNLNTVSVSSWLVCISTELSVIYLHAKLTLSKSSMLNHALVNQIYIVMGCMPVHDIPVSLLHNIMWL